MATLNKKVREFNHGGVAVPAIDAVSRLERSVMSCLLWEDEFYEDGQTISQRISELCGKIEPAEIGRIAIQAKEDMRLRHVPLLLARELARTKAGRREIGNVLSRVILRPDDATEFLSIYWKDNKEEALAKQVKKHLGEAMRKFNEYQLQKYNGGAKAVKLRDVLRVCRPKPADDEQSALWKRLIAGELATPDTWEVELSKGGDKKAAWERLLKENKLGGSAMLRNIRNMRAAGVSDSAIKGGIVGILSGRLLPINFITAARHNPQFEPEIESKFFDCFAGKKKSAGKTVLLIDISPSMDTALSARSELTRTDVACSLAMIAREMFTDVRVFSFSSQCVEVAARRGFALRDAIKNSQPSNGTLLGNALRQVPAYDRLIVITDEESQDSVPQMDGYMINVASTKNGVGYGKWLHIDGLVGQSAGLHSSL